MNEFERRVQDAIDKLVESGEERGIQIAVYHHGEPVVEAIAGVADPATGRLVRNDQRAEGQISRRSQSPAR